VLSSLDAQGLEVVAVRAYDATETLAFGLAGLAGYAQVAVCVVEPEEAVVSIVRMRGGAIVDGTHDLIRRADPQMLPRQLVAILDAPGWEPEAVFVVGSDDYLDWIAAELDDAVAPPVISAAEAELALARGAALAAARARSRGDATHHFEPLTDETVDSPLARQLFASPKVSALTSVLVAAVLTFVVSLSVAVGLRLTPHKNAQTAESRQITDAAAAPQKARPGLSAAEAPPPQAPPPPATETLVEAAPPPESGPPSEPVIEAPVAAPIEPSAAAPAPPPAAPIATPPVYVPPAQNPYVAPQPKHPILSKIPLIRRLPGVSDPVEAAPDQAPPPAPYVPPDAPPP
jgi:hypothetical protein